MLGIMYENLIDRHTLINKFSKTKFTHSAFFITYSKGNVVILVHSINYRTKDLSAPSIHAEHVALNDLRDKLNHSKINKNKKIKVDLVVISTTKTGVLASSKPCYHCLCRINQSIEQLNIKIKNIHYSNEGKIHVEPYDYILLNIDTATISTGFKFLYNIL